MNDGILSAFLDDEPPTDRVGALPGASREDAPESAGRRDLLVVLQCVKDAMAGFEAPEDGLTLGILARLRE